MEIYGRCFHGDFSSKLENSIFGLRAGENVARCIVIERQTRMVEWGIHGQVYSDRETDINGRVENTWPGI